MSSCIMKNQDSDEEVDLEALRLAALKSRKPKYPRVNHNNLIPIVPVPVETPDVANTKIKVEKPSPPPEGSVKVETKEGKKKENEDEKASNYSESTVDNDQDFINMDDKEEEDSLERLMDQLEAEISGKAPIPAAYTCGLKSSSVNKKEKRKKSVKGSGGDDEIELVQIKTGREPGAIIEIRESASPEIREKDDGNKKSYSPAHLNNLRRSKSHLRSRTRSPYLRARNYRRSRSPYWSKSPRRSRSPFQRSRSPFWMSRRSRSTSRRSRSPLRRYRSPGRKRSPFARFSRSRSRSFDRRRSPWSLSPRGRSRSPPYRDDLPLPRRRNYNSPPGRSRRSFTPRDGSKSPRRRSRSLRRFPRSPPFRRSRSPFRRSRSPFRTRSSIRRSHSPYIRRSKSPFVKLNSPFSNRSPLVRKYSKSPSRRSLPKLSDKPSSKTRSKSPLKRNESNADRSPGRLPGKEQRSLSISASPTPRRNRSPLRVLEKNKLETKEKTESYGDRNRSDTRHRSLSREKNRVRDRRGYRQNYNRRFTPTRSKRNVEKPTKSPKSEETNTKNEEVAQQDTKKDSSPTPAEPLDPVLVARKKKFENLSEIDPSVDKKISLKSIKESSENVEDDEDALTINIEGNLWDESDESEDDFESRFKSSEARKNRIVVANRNVLSFRTLRERDGIDKKININKPLTEEDRRDKFVRGDRWLGRRNERNNKNDRKKKYSVGNRKSEENESGRSRSKNCDKTVSHNSNAKKSDRKPIVWFDKNDKKSEPSLKDNEVSTTQCEFKESRSKNSDKFLTDVRDKDIKSNDGPETDDFDKLISDFEKELEGDLGILAKETSSTISANQLESKKPKISVKKDLFDSNVSSESPIKRSAHRTIRVNEISSNKAEKNNESANVFLEKKESHEVIDGPEDYVEDDDFELEACSGFKSKAKEDEDSQSDLRAVLSRRRNQRLTKVVSLEDNVPKRLLQSAFQGLGNKKSKRQIREILEPANIPLVDRSVKSSGLEGRRVLLLQRDKNSSLPSVKCSVTEAVKPDTTMYQRFPRANKRRKRKFQRVVDPVEDLDQEEESFEMEEEKQSRRIRLKRNVTISSQYWFSISK